ncbi:MAG: tetratricopeptide repeat protein [Xenococcaceae cyanobacterium MO_188.B19]|nr:tetratricopeptide repeat protein [Xenococcaceae cyanobacterium MO_188.B19]
MKQKALKRILVVLFGSAFVGSTVFMLMGSILGRREPPATPIADSNVADEAPEVNYRNNLNARLQSQIIGYEKLLEKEPENTTILTNLIRIKLEMGDLEGAVAPLTKLAKLQPERTELVAILKEIETKLAEQKATKE